MMQKYLEDQLDAYTKDTFLATDYTIMNHITKKYEGEDRADAIAIINSKIKENNQNKELYSYILLSLFLISIFLLIFLKNKTNIEFLIFTIYSVLLLSLGVFLPMIAIDARIEELNFPFLGETIQFKDQVLFYKSKSIIGSRRSDDFSKSSGLIVCRNFSIAV